MPLTLPRLADLIPLEGILLDPQDQDRPQVLDALLAGLTASGRFSAAQAPLVRQAVLEREAKGSTAVGGGLALPHGRVNFLDGAVAAFARLREGTGFDPLDGAPVNYVFLLVSSSKDPSLHLTALKNIAQFMRAPANVKALSICASIREAHQVFVELGE